MKIHNWLMAAREHGSKRNLRPKRCYATQLTGFLGNKKLERYYLRAHYGTRNIGDCV